MTIKEYIKLIKKEFSFLFREYDFKITYSEEYRKGYGWFHIGLESKTCRILFSREHGGGNVFFGSPDAPFNDDGDQRWTRMLNLLAYLSKKEWNWEFLDRLSPVERAVAWLSFNAKELEPVCGQILAMFRSQETVAEWKPKYEQFIHNRS
ncbi:MAG TPA: hypothetical protein VJ987_12770 [Anaerolineales bacterium]|nr:hypothetical protein [Anaerolineales bacterium]